MAKERNWVRAAETTKKRGEAVISVKTNRRTADDFEAKCTQNNATKSTILKDYIQRYTYENFDQ